MTVAAIDPQANPFPGLRPFREDEAHLFFGRENQVDAMVDKLAATRFLAVIGSSGSGKSSLVNCGLRPALRQGLMARAGTAWRMAQFRPGNDPIGAMARALAQPGVLFDAAEQAALSLAEIVETTLRMSKLGLVDICEQAELAEGVNLLVVVDQFEELFRYRQLTGAGTLAEDAAAFVNLLLEVKAHPASRIFVVLTMRSDFLGDCTQFPGLAEAINAGQYLVPRLTRDERRAAIEGPMGVGGAQIAPVLLTRLVNDVGDNPDQLSILQHALNRTWALWREQTGGKGQLDLAHYNAIGTMDHALDQHADQAFAELSPHQQKIAEKLFKAITDKATDPRGVRRPTTLKVLSALTDATAEEDIEVIEVFRDPSRSFLMPPAGESLQPDTVIDISHESLMRVWQALIKWADEEAQSARVYRRLADTAELHEVGEANLLRDPDLQIALDWRTKSQPNEAWATRYHPKFTTAMQFLTDSSDARDADRAERRRQRQHELQAEQDKAAAQARFAKRMRLAAVICAAFAVVALVFGALSIWAWHDAQVASNIADQKKRDAQNYLRESQITQSRLLVNTGAQDPGDHSRKILLALEALPDASENISKPFDLLAQQSLVKGLDEIRELIVVGGDVDTVSAVAVMPDGKRIVTGSADGTARLWDAATGAELLQFKGHTRPVRGIAVTPDGKRIVTASNDRTARLWDATTGTELLQFKGHTGNINSVAVTPDGKRVVTGSADRTARLWDATTGTELLAFKGHAGGVNSVAIASDGSRILTGSTDQTARVWDATTGGELFQLASQAGAVMSVAMTPDGRRIVTGSADRTARLWDAATQVELRLLQGHTGAVNGVAITSDGSRVVTGSEDGTARLWNARAGSELLQLKGHSGEVTGVAVTPDGLRIVTGSEDRTARLWDARLGAEVLQVKTGPVLSAAVTSDGGRIVTGAADKAARVWDATTGAEVLQLTGHTDNINSVAVTPDGKRIATGAADRTARLWDATTGAVLQELKGHTRAVNGVAMTPDGKRIVTGSADKTARLWDATTGAVLFELKGHSNTVSSVAVSSDGSRIVTGSADKTARLWDATTGAMLFELKGHTDAVNSVAVSSDGRRIVTGSDDGTARIWDAMTGTVLIRLEGHTEAVSSVAVTSDGGLVVTGSTDETARVWDATTGIELFQLQGHANGVDGVAVTADGNYIVTASDAISRVWELAQLRPRRVQYLVSTPEIRQILLDQAKTLVPRCLSVKQRRTLALSPRPPRWCIEQAKYPYATKLWKSWAAEKIDRSSDPKAANATAKTYGNFADDLLKGGDYRKALEAAELGLLFDPNEVWININRAHALMFLGREGEARKAYEEHVGETVLGKKWEKEVVDDFLRLQEASRCHWLMKEIAAKLKGSLPDSANCDRVDEAQK